MGWVRVNILNPYNQPNPFKWVGLGPTGICKPIQVIWQLRKRGCPIVWKLYVSTGIDLWSPPTPCLCWFSLLTYASSHSLHVQVLSPCMCASFVFSYVQVSLPTCAITLIVLRPLAWLPASQKQCKSAARNLNITLIIEIDWVGAKPL